ncbi:MAG: hypothetical protein N0A24_00630 [Armatimonadetes bacterium]|nr:hypothetical protein [Armatimonadota bacterium]MDW8152726.1 hypothetical protein [Armatimonadota bacterium]
MRPRLGEILLRANLITPEQLEEAVCLQRQTGLRIGAALIQLGYASEDDVAWALATQLQTPYVHASPEMVDPAAVQLLPAHLMERFEVFPLLVSGDELTLVMGDPTDAEAIAEVERATGLRVVPAVDLPSNIRRLIRSFTRGRRSRGSPELAEVQFHLSVAAQAGAHEVYFEPSGSGVWIRYRTRAGLVESRGPRVDPGTLARLAEDPGPLRFRVPLVDRTVIAVLRALPVTGGHALVGILEPETPPALATMGLDPAIREEVERILRSGGLLVVGSPDDLFRRRLLRALAQRTARYAGSRTVAAGLRSPHPLEEVLELESWEALAETHAECVVVDAGWDLGIAGRLCRTLRPGSTLVLGLPYLRVSWALEGLLSLGRLLVERFFTGALCGMPVVALCSCAEVHPSPPPDWPATPAPTRWGSALGCERCRNTGYEGQIPIYEWYRAGPDLAAVLRASIHAVPELLAPALSPSLGGLRPGCGGAPAGGPPGGGAPPTDPCVRRKPWTLRIF